MKALLEFDAPRSCSSCRLWRDERDGFVCVATGKKYYACYMLDRSPDCPLEIEEDEECANCSHSEYISGTGSLYCRIHKCVANEYVCDNWRYKNAGN